MKKQIQIGALGHFLIENEDTTEQEPLMSPDKSFAPDIPEKIKLPERIYEDETDQAPLLPTGASPNPPVEQDENNDGQEPLMTPQSKNK